MELIEVGGEAFRQMARIAGVGPKQEVCLKCLKIVAGRIRNNEDNNFVYGTHLNHKRFICGVHKDLAYYSGEEIICFCDECIKDVVGYLLGVMTAQDDHEPNKGGHFITVTSLNTDGKVELISRFQSNLKEFKEAVSILKNQ